MSKCSVVCEMGLVSPDDCSARGDGGMAIDLDGSLAARAAGVNGGIECVVVVDGFMCWQS